MENAQSIEKKVATLPKKTLALAMAELAIWAAAAGEKATGRRGREEKCDPDTNESVG